MRVLVLSNDLMFTSQVAQSVTGDAFTIETCLDERGLLEKLEEGPVHAVVLDLNLPRVDSVELGQTVAVSHPNARRIAVGPHVHKAKLSTANHAGWSVFTRGQFHADTAEILVQ